MIEILSKIQTELKAPKAQVNKFGGYTYRSCEDILEALKPLLKKYGVAVILSDELTDVGGRIYIKATATLKGEKGEISATAYAREAEQKKGMDDSQLTGATSSYARKYALNGLFAIDDVKDADATNTHDNTTGKPPRLSSTQISDLGQLIELTKTEPQNILAHFKVSELSFLPYEKAKAMLLAKLQKLQGGTNE